MSRARRPLLVALLLGGLVLPFLGKPVHIDDANFLMLARGARLDAWRPHEIPVNWQGSTERAFEVLSNPPGIAWWLAPVAEAPELALHLWMLPWLVLLAWGCWRLGRRFGGGGLDALLLLASAPMVVLAMGALTPDLPLLALCVAGLGGFIMAVDQERAGAAALWALVAGLATWFRYSGVALLPLLFLYPLLQRRRPWPALAGLAPLAALLLHDLHAYGELHLLAMTGFQSVSDGGRDLFRKLVAALAVLGGAGLLPVLALRGGRAALGGAVTGGLLGGAAAGLSALPPSAAVVTVIFCAAGGAVLAGPLVGLGLGSSQPADERADALFLLAWAWGGLLFLLCLRFTAARYWLPFLPAVVLGWTRSRPPRPWLLAALGVQVLVALGLAVDDYAMAVAGRQAAADVHAAAGPASEERVFAGHWGWQHYLEAAGWRPLEDEETLAPGALLAVARQPWPQQLHGSVCLEQVWEREYPDRWPGPRGHSESGRANLHAFVIAGTPPVEVYSPWSFASDPREHAVLYRVCGD